ncbi:ABC transporter substrate-binding protein [Arcicella rosea]|uniref:ABC-type branched-subunit amino acid transport system substrate-binding protein n=1 Tax=Arcicella rosea TaxID=502909 RepID=A0A841ELP9_9BACT|nr:ABC transporter substrate-binding protein [Arcicella rosea]MBB6005077.1 ABC-type branched-subunit amino acid transport system substrate-binding protein [Arcicella rosea]
MLNRFIWILLLLFTFQVGKAQNSLPEYELAYKKALELYKNHEYEKAKFAFTNLSNSQLVSALVPNSFYFSALSAIKLKEYSAAKTALKNLITVYPSWTDKTEINFLLTLLAFEDKKYSEAFGIAQKIPADSLQDDLNEMKAFYVRKIDAPKLVQELSKKYPNETSLSDKVQQNIVINTTSAGVTKSRTSKGYFNFGLLLPVEIDSFGPDKTRKNQYALDLYQGMKLAKAQLLKEGITLNCFVYDMINEPDEMLELVNNRSFQMMDLLVGPLYTETNKIATAYCEANQIPIVNPMSNNQKILQDYNLSFLAQPSLAMQAAKAADFVSRQAFLGRNTAIYYSDAQNDSLMAVSYREQMEKIGYEIVKFEKIKSYSEDIVAKLPEKRVSHIFMSTSDKKAGLSMITALNKKEIMTPLVTTAEAFNSYNLSNGTLSGREIYCINPEFVDNEKPEVDAFRKDYLAKYGVIPSYYAFHGYDLALFWGRLFGKNGYNIRKSLDTPATYNNAYTLMGFNYFKSQDNQICPITTLDNFKFVLAK